MDESELIQVINGERDAIRSFVREYLPVLRGAVRRRLVGPYLNFEEDLLQDLLLGLFSDKAHVLRMFDPAKGRSLKNFLYMYASQRSLDWLRRQRRQSREEPSKLVPLDESTINDPSVERSSWVEPLLERFRKECSPEEINLLDMFYIQELPVGQIAQRLGISTDALYQRRHRLKMRLLILRQQLLKEEQGS